MRPHHLRACFVTALFAALPSPSRAAFLELVSSGTEAVGATVGTSTLTTATAYTATAIFDTTTGTSGPSGIGYTIDSLTISLTGFGTFTAAPGNDVRVYLEDPTTTGSFYAAGFENGGVTNGYVGTYTGSSNTSFSGSAPSPTVFSGYGTSYSAGFLIKLTNGAGSFSIGDITTAPITSSIIATTSVPEPSSLAMVGAGLAFLGLAVRRRGLRAGL